MYPDSLPEDICNIMAIAIIISEMYVPKYVLASVQSIYVDNPVLSEGLFGGTESLLFIFRPQYFPFSNLYLFSHAKKLICS